MSAVTWSLVMLAAFLRWGGPASLPWRGHRDGDRGTAAAHVAAAMAVARLLDTWSHDALLTGTLAVMVTIAASGAVSAAWRRHRSRG